MDLIQAIANVSPDVPEGLAQTSTVGFGVADADQAGIGEQFRPIRPAMSRQSQTEKFWGLEGKAGHITIRPKR